MTLVHPIKTAHLARLGRLAAGTALGFALVAALLAPWAGKAHAEIAAGPVAIAAEPSAEAGPALWVIKDADSTIYLFGTVHFLRPGKVWEPARVTAAFNSASEVWFEIENPDDVASMIPLIRQYGISPQTPLSGQLTPDEMTRLDTAARVINATGIQMDVLRPWYAGLLLSIAPLVKAGYDPKSGVDQILKARAEAAGKPVHGLETQEKQIRMLADLPQDIQLEFLRQALKDFDEPGTELDALIDAWVSGDVVALDRIGNQDMKTGAPDIYKALLTDRNAGFADQIQTLLAGSGTAFVAVGAAHLAGDDSVQTMLEARGIAVERE